MSLPVPVPGGTLRRAVLALAILLLGAMSFATMSRGGRGIEAHPAIELHLGLPSGGDAADVAQRWGVALESLARSVPGAGTIRGEVHARGARFVVGLRPGTDPERAAARAAAGFGALRRDLPEGAFVGAVPLASIRDRGLVVALRGAGAMREGHDVVESLRALPGVRAVDAAGLPSLERHVALRQGDARLAESVEAALHADRLGAWLGRSASGVSGRLLPVTSLGPPAEDAIVALGGQPLPLSALAMVTDEMLAPRALAMVDGAPAVLLSVRADHDVGMASVHAGVDALLRDRVAASGGGLRADILFSDADAARRLLARLAAGLLAASVAAGLVGLARGSWAGAARLGATLPLAAAAALQAAWLAGLPLDEITAPAMALGILLAAPLALARLEGALRRPAAVIVAGLAGVPVPVALRLAGGQLAPEWAPAAEAFAIALAAGALSTLVWPRLARRRARTRRAWRGLRVPLADPLTALLAVASVAYIAFASFGGAIDPRAHGGGAAEGSMVTVSLAFADGTPVSRSAAALHDVQAWLAARPEIRLAWGQAYGERANAVALLNAGTRGDLSTSRLLMALRHQAWLTGATARVGVSRATPAADLLATSDEERASTDEHATSYRVVLRGTNAEAMLVAIARIREAAVRAGVPWSLHEVEARPAAPRIEASPRKGAAGGHAPGELAALLAPELPRRSGWHARHPTELVVTWPGAPDPDAPMPQRHDLLQRPRQDGDGMVVPESRAVIGERAVIPELRREDGRFIVPLRFRFAKLSEDLRQSSRRSLDSSLSVLRRLPAGCELERPSISGLAWPPERLRLLVLALAVPVVLWAVAALVVDALLPALGALLCAVAGLSCAAVAMTLSGQRLDGQAFTLLACALCGSLGLPIALLARARDTRLPAARWAAVRAARLALPCVVVLVLGSLGLLAALRGLDAAEDTWASPLAAALVAVAAVAISALIVAPSTSLVLAELRRRLGRDAEALRRPPAWRAAGEPGAEPVPPSLGVRHLTKIHPGGVQALVDVSLDLEPGIVGLLGPNGAGKTTLLRCMTSLVRPTRGEVRYRGVVVAPENLVEFRRHLGFLPQDFNAYPGLSARQFLEYWALERGMRDRLPREAEIERRLAEVDLVADADRLVRDYSGGMRQRLGIARALLGSPPLLVVDEPTTGLDVESRTRFRSMLLAVAAERLVILSTHVASDVEATASRLLLLHAGRIRFDGPPSLLVERAEGRVVEALVPDADLREFSRRYRVTARVRVLSGIRVRAVVPPGEALPGTPVRPSLEEAYLAEIDLAGRQ